MGCYVNPRGMDKDQWLAENGQRTTRQAVTIGMNEVPVCLVDNGFFSAGAVCYSERELEAFSQPSDFRPKVWYMVSREKLRTVSDLANYER